MTSPGVSKAGTESVVPVPGTIPPVLNFSKSPIFLEIVKTFANPDAIIAAPVANPKTPPCANALFAPAYVSMIA